MEKFVKCKTCGEVISRKAPACPKCGARTKRKTVGCAAAVGIVMLVAVLSSILVDSDRPASQSASKPAATVPSRKAIAPKPVTVIPTIPTVTVTAERLYADYDANEVAADMKYKGKLALIDGRVSDIGVVLGKTYVSLKTGNMIMSVQCFFDDSENQRIARLKKDQMILVRGLIDGKSLNVTVNDCTIIK